MRREAQFYLPDDFVRVVIEGVELDSPAWSHVAICCICDHTYHEHGTAFAFLACRCCGSTREIPVRIERRKNVTETYLYHA